GGRSAPAKRRAGARVARRSRKDNGGVRRIATPLAWTLWAVSIAGFGAPVAFQLAGGHVKNFGDQPGSAAPFVAVLLFILTFATVGAVLASKRPENPIGWLLSASAVFYGLGGFAILLARWSVRWSDWIQNWVWGLGIGLTGLFVLLLFPTGALPSRRWRPVAWFASFALLGIVVEAVFSPGLIQGTHSVNPLGAGGAIGRILKALGPVPGF